jgi:hypothetical protein
VGVPFNGDGTLWFDPARRYATPGLILPEFQGWECLVIDTATWKASRGVIPLQPAAFNIAKYTYAQAFEADVRRFTVKAEFSGYPEYRERRRFMALSPEEQSRKLKESLEEGVPDSSVTSATIRNATDPDQNVNWEAEGSLESAPKAILHFDPFPGMPSPLRMPRSWPETRTEPIIIDNMGIQGASCEFKVPKGYHLKAADPFVKENSFGKVVFVIAATPKDGETLVKASLRVDVAKGSAPAGEYADFRTFMGWIDEAYRREILLEKQ